MTSFKDSWVPRTVSSPRWVHYSPVATWVHHLIFVSTCFSFRFLISFSTTKEEAVMWKLPEIQISVSIRQVLGGVSNILVCARMGCDRRLLHSEKQHQNGAETCGGSPTRQETSAHLCCTASAFRDPWSAAFLHPKLKTSANKEMQLFGFRDNRVSLHKSSMFYSL